MAAALAPTALMCFAAALSFFLNGFFLFNFVRRRRLRKADTLPLSILLVHLAIIDVIASLLWTLFAALSAAAGEWILPDAFCKLTIFVMGFCNIINSHTLMLLMFERFLHIFKPSKRQEIFFDLVVCLMLVAMYLFDGVIAAFPLWGWGEIAYDPKQYQCAVDYEINATHFDFTVAMHFGIPVVVILGFYIAILIRVQILKKRAGQDGQIILEENMECVGDSYSDRLKQQYLKFQGAGTKQVKPKMKAQKADNKDGFCNESDDYDSSEEEPESPEEKVSLSDKFKNRKQNLKKTYYLSKSDMKLTHMFAIMAALYFTLWLPYVVRSMIYTYYYYDIALGDGFIVAAVCLSHYGSCCKVPLYLMFDKIRAAVKKTLGIGQNVGSQNDYKPSVESTTAEQTTEL